MGYNVKGFTPTAPDESQVDFGHRFEISQIGDDGRKADFLRGKLRTPENPNPQVFGQGRDWYTFDPGTGKYIALTNKSSWDMSDIMEAIPAAVKGAASTAGMAAGTLGGPMGMAAGAAGGSMAADAGMRTLTGLVDPDYRKAQTWAEEAKQVGLEGAISGVLGGLGGAIAAPGIKAGAAQMAAKAAGQEIPELTAGQALSQTARKAMTTGPLSTMARAAGWTGENLASGGGQALRWLGGGPIRRDVAASVTPVLNKLQIPAMISELPQQALTGIPKLAAKAARSKLGSWMLGENAEPFANAAEGLLRPRASQTSTLALNRAMRGTAEETSARSAGGNIGEMIGSKLAGATGKDVSAIATDAEEQALRDMGRTGIGEANEAEQEFAANAGQTAGKNASEANAAREAAWSKAGGKAGEKLGTAADVLGTAGRGVNQALNTTAGIGANVAGYGAYIPQYLSKGLRVAGEVGQPFENYLAARQGLSGLAEEQMAKRFPYKKAKSKGTVIVNK